MNNAEENDETRMFDKDLRVSSAFVGVTGP